MKDSKKTILVTGGTGYIGAHTTVSLLEHGYDVIVIDNLVNSNVDMIDRIGSITGIKPVFYEADLTDICNLKKILRCHDDLVAVIHFAALKAVGESVQKPLYYYHNNLLALINLLKAMGELRINNLVFSSSATVYGEPDNLPLTEDSPTKPAMSPYGNTKKVGEEIIKDVCKASPGFNSISLRYFNPIGAHSSGKIGELPNGAPNNLMPYITQTAAGVREELLVFGNDYNTPDGTAIRDYIHVEDLADAHVLAVDRMLKKSQSCNYEVFNLGTGRGNSVLEVINSFEKTSQRKLQYRIVERRAGDVEEMYASTELAIKELNWMAKYNLDAMTRSSWEWEKKVRSLK